MLPGGIWQRGERRREYRFRPANGAMELDVTESWTAASSVPAAVTAVLAASLEEIGGEAVDGTTVRDLAVGDRQYLMRRLAVHLGMDRVWLSATCAHCESRYDLLVEQSVLPSKPVDGGPWEEAVTSRGNVSVRALSGADQELIVNEPDDEAAELILLTRCTDGHSGAIEFSAFTDDDIARLEQAIESVSPEVTTTVTARCPECGESNEVLVDPYLGVTLLRTDLLEEIHTMANAYHWSEADILELPVNRRRRYLDLIAQGV